MSEINHNSTIAINAFCLDDLHTDMLYQVERIEHVIAVARLASESNDTAQLKGAINMMIDSLSDTSAMIQNDHESMTHLINDSAVITPKIGA